MTGPLENYFLGSEFNIDKIFFGTSTIKKSTCKLQFSDSHTHLLAALSRAGNWL
jgi:hypothetical protein